MCPCCTLWAGHTRNKVPRIKVFIQFSTILGLEKCPTFTRNKVFLVVTFTQLLTDVQESNPRKLRPNWKWKIACTFLSNNFSRKTTLYFLTKQIRLRHRQRLAVKSLLIDKDLQREMHDPIMLCLEQVHETSAFFKLKAWQSMSYFLMPSSKKP